MILLKNSHDLLELQPRFIAWTLNGHQKRQGATLSRNPLFYLVELAGVEPASEISTPSVLHA